MSADASRSDSQYRARRDSARACGGCSRRGRASGGCEQACGGSAGRGSASPCGVHVRAVDVRAMPLRTVHVVSRVVRVFVATSRSKVIVIDAESRKCALSSRSAASPVTGTPLSRVLGAEGSAPGRDAAASRARGAPRAAEARRYRSSSAGRCGWGSGAGRRLVLSGLGAFRGAVPVARSCSTTCIRLAKMPSSKFPALAVDQVLHVKRVSRSPLVDWATFQRLKTQQK